MQTESVEQGRTTVRKQPSLVNLAPAVEQLLWACAGDDDDLADWLADLFIVNGATYWINEVLAAYADRDLLARVVDLQGQARRVCLLQEREVLERAISILKK